MEEALVTGKPFHSKVLFDFLGSPSFRRALGASNLAKLQAKVDHYKQFSGGEIESLEFQERAIADACRKRSGLWCGELWTGAGKSIIGARIALEFLRRGGKVVFICPNRMGIGDASDGIIQKFHRTFRHYQGTFRIGDLDAVTPLDDVNFFTPHAFVRMSQASSDLFRKIISGASLLIVDEAHHFPEDPKGDQVIYGKIEKIASKHFIDAGKKVATLTATHGRHDGKSVFRKKHPDFRITVDEAVQAGWCPEIHGLPVYLTVKAPKAVRIANEYSLNLSKKQLLLYLRQVAGVMIEVQKENPSQQFCAFVRTISEARKLQEIWNYEAWPLGFLPVALLVGTTRAAERIEIKRAIHDGKYSGYITCNVGSESIDIPRLETVHLIQRTRSINKIVQSIGRALRNSPEKRRTLIVDYHLSERKIIRACQGLEAYAKYVHSRAKRLVSGGPLVPIDGTSNADFSGISIGEERVWIERSLTPGAIQEGRVFGWLTVVRYDSAINILCRCKCGKECISRRDRLLSGKSISCGCYKKTVARIEPGTRFGKLVVEKYISPFSVRCKCDCGRTTVTYKGCLVVGSTKSCGCIREPYGPMRKGRRLGKLVVLEDLKSDHVKCRCDCGKEIITNRVALRGSRRCCGCSSHYFLRNPIKAGQRFGRLRVLEDSSGCQDVVCVCDCGNLTICKRSSLRIGEKKSCGCLALERAQNAAKTNPEAITIKRNRIAIKRGSTFGWLVVLVDRRCDDVQCRCRCGRVVRRQRAALLSGEVNSCGCRGRSEPLENGAVFSRLTVLSDDGSQRVRCRCRCGNVVVLMRCRITSGNTKSCGCLNLGTPLRKGRRFGKLKVVEDRGTKKVLCLCDCGKKKFFIRGFLGRQNSSCGCLRAKKLPDAKRGQRFGSWTALRQGPRGEILCRCKCGTERLVQKKHLYSGASKSCGCANQIPRFKEGAVLKGLTVLSDSEEGIRGHGRRRIRCRCFCGKETLVEVSSLKNGAVSSCGCRRKRMGRIKSGVRSGILTVIQDEGCEKVGCLCDCGREVVLRRHAIVLGQKSCGCLYSYARRLKPGSRYGEWTILSDVGCRQVRARCSCGFVKTHHYRPNLTSGKSKCCINCGKRMKSIRLTEANKARGKVL